MAVVFNGMAAKTLTLSTQARHTKSQNSGSIKDLTTSIQLTQGAGSK